VKYPECNLIDGGFVMRNTSWLQVLTAAALVSLSSLSLAQSTISYGRITAIRATTVSNAQAQTAGALVGGTIGLATGSGRSASNRALRTVGGGLAGQQVTRLATNEQAYEFTILVGGTSTISMITDQSGFRVGDCVSVERGAFNNMRMAADAKCAANAQPSNADLRESEACLSAKEALFEAQTDEAFNVAERRVRLLCNH
jgi:outer membrane lipoprotein SlyB